MGFQTVVVISNDALGAFEKDPKAFGQAILDGIARANYDMMQVSVPFGSYANYLHVEPSRHADHETVYVSTGNCLSVVGAYERDYIRWTKSSPQFADKLVRVAERIVKDAKAYLKANGGKK